MIAEPEARQDRRRLRAHLGKRAPPEPAHRHHHVLARGEFRQQEMELEHEADPRQPDRGARVVVERGGRRAVDQHVALARRVEQAEQVEQRGFARA
jgi:hypothetical protein